MILGMFSTCFPGFLVLASTILGIAALILIRRSSGQLTGRGMAIAGISISAGYVGMCIVMFWLALAFLAGFGQ